MQEKVIVQPVPSQGLILRLPSGSGLCGTTLELVCLDLNFDTNTILLYDLC